MILDVLGIDPGLAECGFAAIQFDTERPDYVGLHEHGMIKTPKDQDDPMRLRYIFDALSKVRQMTKCEYVGTEKYFVFLKKHKGVGKIGNDNNDQKMNQAVGAVLIAMAGLKIEQYSPSEMKRAITGDGNADKKKVQEYTRVMLGLHEVLTPNHIADAAGHALLRLFKTNAYIKSGSYIHVKTPLFEENFSPNN